MIALTTFIRVVSVGKVVRVYSISGGQRTLKVGFNIIPPWDRTVQWDASAHAFVFLEAGDDGDPNDAFGGQTNQGDYVTTVANLVVRIDTENMDEFVATFGDKCLDDPVSGGALKSICKNALERVIEEYRTEEVMKNKSKITGAARLLAVQRIESSLPLRVVELEYPDVAASPEYEAAIQAIADARMQRQLADGEKEVNEAKAVANAVKADGEKAVAQINADANKYKAITAAEATAEASKIEGDASAYAIRAAGAAEADVAERLGVLLEQYPGLIESKRLAALVEVMEEWDGQLVPQVGGGGVSILDIAKILESLNQSPQSPTP
jgi:regulator of protease activity HflC (stomatin/prohibitin superfamily)